MFDNRERGGLSTNYGISEMFEGCCSLRESVLLCIRWCEMYVDDKKSIFRGFYDRKHPSIFLKFDLNHNIIL